MSAPVPQLRGLPFPGQIAAIEAAVARGDGAALLPQLTAFRDHEPLAHTLALLSDAGQLDAIAIALADSVLRLPDTGLRRVLRSLENTHGAAAFAQALDAAAEKLPVDRIVAASMIDRWLKNTAPEIRQAAVDTALEQCRLAVQDRRPAEVRDAPLMRLPGSAYASLQALATAAGVSEAWQQRIAIFAAAVLDTLEAQPKSLSQANAEDLLSRQVYTDPGHFLIELLQNADDAGARHWRVHVFDDRVEVEHDGAPFDARDVVGILSIGQTTKGKDKIGFFGVGFKSVYDICERPQIYSGPFAFEIADVSLPRPLAKAPRATARHTLLVLPLRNPNDPDRTPARLFERMEKVPGEVLLTLNSLQEIDVQFGARRHWVRTTALGRGRIRLDEQDSSRTFVVHQTQATYDGPRDASRTDTTPVLLAVTLDENGCPVPCGRRPTVYSYLPTGERSGLRFLVHAHFDLPVDRERLDLSSAWNQWAIGRIGPLLAGAISALVRECEDSEDSEELARANARVDAVLAVIPLAAELIDDSYRVATEHLAQVAFLPGAAGERLAPEHALLAQDHRLVTALAGVKLQGGRRLLRPLAGRDADVAQFIGAQPLAIESVVDLVAQDAQTRTPGATFDPPWDAGFPAVASVIGQSAVSVDELLHAACLPDSRGCSQAPADVVRASGALRSLLAPLMPLVREDMVGTDCERFMDRLGIRIATTADFLAGVNTPNAGRSVVESVGVGPVIAHLMGAPKAHLEGCESAYIVPTDTGEIAAIGDVFLTGKTPLAHLIRTASVRPPVVSQACEQEFGHALAQLGTPHLDLRTALALIQRGALTLAVQSILAFHEAIDQQRDFIDNVLANNLARAAIFPCSDGSLRPLVGDACAHVPADTEIRALWPARPWLDETVARLPYVQRLGVPMVGANAVAHALVTAPAEEQFRRQAFSYLSLHAQSLSADTVARLVVTSLWPDIDGRLRPLAQLRELSPHQAVARLYELWPQATTIESGAHPGSAMHLARTLDIAHHVVQPDLSTVLDDLAATTNSAHSPAIDLDRPELADAVGQVLTAAATQLPRARLERARDAAIYLCADGIRRRLGRWDSPSPDRAHRVTHSLRAAFSHGRYPLVTAESAARYATLFDALDVAPGTAVDLVTSVDGALDQADEHVAATVRAALVTARTELASATQAVRSQLSELRLWPTASGLRSSSTTIRPTALREALGSENSELWRDELATQGLQIVDDDAADQADAAASILDFATPAFGVNAVVDRLLMVDAPLASQHPLLSTTESVARISVALGSTESGSWSSPIAVDALGRVVARSLLRAQPAELAVLGELAIAPQLAAAAWAEHVAGEVPGALTWVSPRQVIAALRDASSEPMAPEAHPGLSNRQRRSHLYQWLIEHQQHLIEDEQSRGSLGKTCFVLSRGGVLRAPRDFMFDDALPDLGIDWNPHEELPPRLENWLRATYRPEAKQLRTIVDHLLTAADEAATKRDGLRHGALLLHLARALRADDDSQQLQAHASRFKLRKRLRVETQTGEFERPRTLLAPDARDADLITRFVQAPPATISARYADPVVLRLLRAAGCESELSEAALNGYVAGTGRRSGADSVVAFACYLAATATRNPGRRASLKLTRKPNQKHTAWLPDRAGDVRPADQLYWPANDVAALIGDDPHRFVHPELVHRVPEAKDWIGVCTADNAELVDVVAYATQCADTGRPVSDTTLAWLDDSLAAGTISATAVHDALAHVRCMSDDHGRLRAPSDLVIEGSHRLYGSRRGDWAPGARFTRLASALRIPRRPGKRTTVAYLTQIARLLADSPDLLTADPELVERLPRCIDLLVEERGSGPASLPLVCYVADAATIIIVPGDVEPALTDQPKPDAPIVRIADGADRNAWRLYLRDYGVDVGADDGGDVGAGDDRAGDDRADDDRADVQREEASDTRRPLEPAHDKRQRAPEQEQHEGPGLISRLRDWFRSDADERDDEHDDERDDDERDDEQPRRAPPQGERQRRRQPRRESESASASPSSAQHDDDAPEQPGQVDQRNWFRADRWLESQLGSNAAWLADRDRVAQFGLAHAPATLPLPYRYSPVAIFASFDRRRQSWRRLAAYPAWTKGSGNAGRLHLRGRLPSGEAVIPVPLYGRVVDVVNKTSSKTSIQLINTADRVVMLSDSDSVVAITVTLDEAPDFSNARAADADALFTQTIVSDQELPDEAHDLVSSLSGEPSALRIVETVRSFIRERYAYDPTYLEDPAIAAWLRQRTRSRSNIHVAALHAGRDADHLGRGVCYELNTLACELLRRAGVPAAVATGWTFDRGYVDEPDHLWAMALLDAGDGPRWLPVDASTTHTGRPLHAAHRPAGPWTADTRNARKVREPTWAKRPSKRRRAPAIPINDLLRVARYVEQATGDHLGTRDELLAKCRRLLADPERAEALAQLLADVDADPSALPDAPATD